MKTYSVTSELIKIPESFGFISKTTEERSASLKLKELNKLKLNLINTKLREEEFSEIEKKEDEFVKIKKK